MKERAMHMSRTTAALQDAMRRSPVDCPICGVVTAETRQYVDHLFYERVNDIPTRETLRKAGGFCRRHAHVILQQADALGSALIFEDVLNNNVRRLRSGSFDRPPGNNNPLARLFGDSRPPVPGEQCPVCVMECEVDERAVDSLMEALDNQEFRDAFTASIGICLPHFRLAHLRARDPQRWDVVLQTEIRSLEVLAAELGSLARKYDYQVKDKPRGAEAECWKQALKITSGWFIED